MEKQACTQNRSRTLKAIIKKAAISAAVIGMVFIMLLSDSCGLLKYMDKYMNKNVTRMDRVYSSDIANSMNVDDYNNKKEEFLSVDDTRNLDFDLQVVPENYYKQKFGLTDEQVANLTACNYFFCLEDALYLCGLYYDESFLEDKLVLKTLFRYKLDPAIIQDLIDAINNNEIKNEGKSFYMAYDSRNDRVNNYNYRYLLNHIINNCKLEVVAENYDKNDDLESGIGNVFLDEYIISTGVHASLSSNKNNYIETYFMGGEMDYSTNASLKSEYNLYYAYDDHDSGEQYVINGKFNNPLQRHAKAFKTKSMKDMDNIYNMGKIVFMSKSYFLNDKLIEEYQNEANKLNK